MKTAVCCIAKCENNYLKEWADYHLSMGFSHIFIYDNNNKDGERIEPLFEGNNLVTVLNCRGEKAFQPKAYKKFYKEYGRCYDWIAFIDVDEFITFSKQSGIKSIADFLSRFDERVDIVHLNWMCFGDSGVVELDENYSVLDRFKEPLELDKKVQYDFPENNHVKSIYRGNLNIDIDNMEIGPHTIDSNDYYVVDAKGKRINNTCFIDYDFSVAYVRHYVTKTIYEWLLKISRGLATLNAVSELYTIERFFLYNEKTKEKEAVIAHYLFYKEAIEQSIATNLAACNKEIDYLKRQLEHVLKNYNVVVNSNAYKIGRALLKPFKRLSK